jgi:hypothetical protein
VKNEGINNKQTHKANKLMGTFENKIKRAATSSLNVRIVVGYVIDERIN